MSEFGVDPDVKHPLEQALEVMHEDRFGFGDGDLIISYRLIPKTLGPNSYLEISYRQDEPICVHMNLQAEAHLSTNNWEVVSFTSVEITTYANGEIRFCRGKHISATRTDGKFGNEDIVYDEHEEQITGSEKPSAELQHWLSVLQTELEQATLEQVPIDSIQLAEGAPKPSERFNTTAELMAYLRSTASE